MRAYPLEFGVKLTKEELNRVAKYFPVEVIETEDEVVTKPLGFSFNEETQETVFSVREIPYLFNIFQIERISFDFSELIQTFNYGSAFDVTNPDFLRPEQYGVAKNMAIKSGGVVQCRTGWGKGTLITYLVKHYIGNGNVLIIGPTLSVLDELKARFQKYNLTLDNVMFIHAAGFNNSGYKDDEYHTEFMKKVDLIIVDEIENVPVTLENIFRIYCLNYRYIYGFSATANKYTHSMLVWDPKIITKLSRETMSVMYFFGQSLAFFESQKRINIIKAYSRIPPEYPNPYKGDNFNFMKAVENAVMNLSVIKYIKYIKQLYPENTLLIPVKTKKQGQFIYDNIKGLMSSVFWYGGGFEYNKNDENLVGLKNYDTLKERVDQGKIQALICTQVGYRGVDFQTISDILLIVGTSNAIVTQIVGRAERFTGEIRVWMLYNIDDKGIDFRSNPNDLLTPILDACNGARMKQLVACHSHSISEIDNLEDLI